MRISISNLAWADNDEQDVFDLLRRKSISAIEITPTRYFPDLATVTENQALDLKKRLSGERIRVSSFQALLFGQPDLKLFGTAEQRKRTAEHLIKNARIAAWLGADKIIFGSPKNRRVPENMDHDMALALATEFFKETAEQCGRLGVTLCISPNAKEYGCNFCVRVSETAGLVRAVDSPAFRLHLDSGVMLLNDEDPRKAVMNYVDIVEHVHASEPLLATVGQNDVTSHRLLAKALSEHNYEGYVSVEMLPPPDGLTGIERSLDFAVRTYGYVDG